MLSQMTGGRRNIFLICSMDSTEIDRETTRGPVHIIMMSGWTILPNELRYDDSPTFGFANEPQYSNY